MTRIAICDDAEYIRKETDKLILEYFINRNLEYSVKQYECGEELENEIEKFDIVFLDYQFEDKGQDGLSIARAIRKNNKDVTIIFLTSYTSIVYDTFEVSTFRFLVKPLDKDKMFAALDDYFNLLEEEETLIVKIEGVNYYIKEKQISFVEGYGKKCIIHFINKDTPLECNETLIAIEERLPQNNFYRCHKSFLVNMRYVNSFSHTDLCLENDDMVNISRKKYKRFYEAYTDYLIRK